MIAAWIFGIGGLLANFLIYQQTSRKRLLQVKRVADCLWTVHYGMLAAWSGAAICAIGILRESVFLNENKKWAKGKRWLIVFLILSALSAMMTWKNIFSILPSLASLLSIFSFWRGNPTVTRIMAFPISACFMTYNVICGSYVGILNEVIVLSSAVIGIIRALSKFKKSL